MAKYNELGQQIPDQTPIEVPLGFQKPETIEQKMQRLIRTEISARAEEHGMESFEEADDFDVPDDEDDNMDLWESQYQMTEMQEQYFEIPPSARPVEQSSSTGDPSPPGGDENNQDNNQDKPAAPAADAS